MFKNYLKIALRNFLKHKSYTLLNVVGLSLGMIASLLIIQYVKYERSFDTFHSKASDIYRIQYNGWQNGKKSYECAAAVPAAGPALRNNFPEVKQFTRLFPISGIISYESPENGVIAFREEKMQITDPAVFEVFDFKLLKGNQAECLKGPNKVVITQGAAKKYFGDSDPMGKTISLDGNRKYEVTGILEDVPANSHIKFNFLFSFQTLNNDSKNESENSWGWYDFNTYVLLQPGTDLPSLQAKWNAWLAIHRKLDWDKYNFKQEFILRPLLDIHLHSKLLQESMPDEQGDGNQVYALTFIALFILIIAWVNYINLATARSFDRANEVGVRKVMGALKDQLVKQFMAESFLVNVFAALISVALVRALWPAFSSLAGRNIPVEYMNSTDFWLLVGALFFGGAILSGFYPAIILSSFKPVVVLKGKINRSTQGSFLRKSLVVFQFAMSVFLIVSSVVVYQQLKFMQHHDLGVDINGTLVLKGPGAVDSLYEQNLESFKTEALRVSGVKSMTASSNVPGDEIFWTRGIKRLQGGPESAITVYNVGIDYDYVPAFGLKMIAGRNFDKQFKDDKRILLNRSLAKSLEYDDPETAIGEKVRLGRDTFEIAGVMEDYHQMSLKSVVTPLVFRMESSSTFFAFKVESGNYQEILTQLEGPWKEFFPGNPVDYFFLDQFFSRQYASDRQIGQVFTLFTALAIFIACLGLFGLASFMTMQRTKEIGIRKVLGSTVSHIVILLSKGFIQLVILANLIAWPFAYFLMDWWLTTLPYHIEINPLLFVAAGIVVVALAFISVGFQTFRAAQANPAKTLKYE